MALGLIPGSCRASCAYGPGGGFMVVEIVVAAWGLLRGSAVTLPEVASVHDLHVWVVTSDLPAVSAHVVASDECFAKRLAPSVLDQMQARLAGHFDVEHSTFQLEPAGHIDHEHAPHD